MATPFESIYKRVLNIKEDYDDINYTDDEIKKHLFSDLQFAIAMFGDLCYKNLYDLDETLEQFNVDLNYQEIDILAEAMIIPFLERKINKTILLNQIVYGKDFSTNSQANHIKEVRETIKQQKNEVEKKMNLYTYRQSPNRLNGLGGNS